MKKNNRSRYHSVLHKLYHQPGTAPGTLTRHRSDHNIPAAITLIRYSENSFDENKVTSLEECRPEPQQEGLITWIRITGADDPELLQQLNEHYGIHPLSLEDVNNAGQRPKWEVNDGYDFGVFYRVTSEKEVTARQVNLFLGKNFLITLVRDGEDGLTPVRDRLYRCSGKIRERGSDYLCYAVCDCLIDGFAPLLESVGESLDDLEDRLIANPDRKLLSRIHHLKRKLLVLAKLIWAEREAVSALLRGDSRLMGQEVLRYLRDCYDHTVQYIDVIEVYRDMATGMVDAYLSSVSNQMNAVMKVLTIIATIFIPLSFLVGVYGMNFKNMPELQWDYGYPALWCVMIAIALGMLFFFKRKKWL